MYDSNMQPNNNTVNNRYNTNNNLPNSGREDVVSMGLWLGIIILLALPFINFISLLILAFIDVNQNIKNFARASLILLVIGFIFTMLLSL